MTRLHEKKILVFADWIGLEQAKPLGVLHSQQLRGKEIFDFEYENSWLESNYAIFLDPQLGLYQGKQYLPDQKENFGLFLDSSPDRWGRMLMRRREAAIARKEGRSEKTLLESDYLLGVYDGHRLGGLRFMLAGEDHYSNNNKQMATPPWASLRELEYVSQQLEREDAAENPSYLEWLNLLVAPGSSLGGARPKASILDESGQLWMAKFPSALDDKDTGAWEMVLHELALQCGIKMPEARLLNLSGQYHTYLSKRFDRLPDGRRIHFASAMTLLGYNDGVGATEGVSYLELAAFITQQSSSSTADLEQLWRRILFSIMVSNTDDHLRNHGFLLGEEGWSLSPAFDLNPNQFGTGLQLNISENDNALDTSLALDMAGYYRIGPERANVIYREMYVVIESWKKVAATIGIPRSEILELSPAFRPK